MITRIPTVNEALCGCIEARSPEDVSRSTGKLLVAIVAADNALQTDVQGLNSALNDYLPDYDGSLDANELREHFRDGLANL